MDEEQLFRATFERAPVGLAHVSQDGKWRLVNRRLCEITGYSQAEMLATDFQHITFGDDLPQDLDALARLASGELQNYSIEKRYIHKDGHIVWVKLTVSPGDVGEHEQPLFLIVVVDDITAYKRDQEKRQQSEEKFSKAFRQSPMAIMLTSAIDHRYIEVNDAFERLTGYTREEAIGRTPFDLNLWFEPQVRYEVVDALLAGGNVQEREARFRTKDGRVLMGLGFAERIDIDGEPCMLGAVLDITDRKRLEAELQELSGRLIKAQDDERRLIATELTDSLGQSVAAVNFEAGKLARSAHGELSRELQSLSAKIRDIAAGIGIISQSLYPAGLDFTGLPWAIEGLCRQFTHLYGLQVAFKHEGIPHSLSPETALCLYRTVQEGLRNVIQHSGTREAWIELTCDGADVLLRLWDRGVGYPQAATNGGLGLLIMRERCHRLNGELTVYSQNGAHIELRIPIGDAQGSLFVSGAVGHGLDIPAQNPS